MNCNSNCGMCFQSLNCSNRDAKTPSIFNVNNSEAMKTLMLPSMAFAPMFDPRFQNNFDAFNATALKSDVLFHPFPPLFGLNMKINNSPPPVIKIPRSSRSKVDFSVEALTKKDPPLLPSPPVVNRTDVTHSKLQSEETCTVKPASLKNRGRPSADSIHLLKQKSLENPHRYQCDECGRSFPRKKSLDTHRLIHSDIKPYACDFPGCNRKFKQSGQLKTHLRLHTGEKPFRCTYPTCVISFAHANRKCPYHPDFPLQRVVCASRHQPEFSERIVKLHRFDNIDCEQVKSWLEKQYLDKGKTEPECANEIKIEPELSLVDNKNILRDRSNLRSVETLVNKNSTLTEENRRLLSAVALVELQQPTSIENKENAFQ